MPLDFCDDCNSLLQRCAYVDRSGLLTSLCLLCGDELIGCADSLCDHCQGTRAAFTRIVVPYRYAFPLDKLVQSLKYHEQRTLGRVFGSLLAQAVRQATPRGIDLPTHLVPVPLHPARYRERGFNQSADIARWCARELALEYSAAATREWDTGSLAGLSRAERQHRILGAFRAAPAVAGRHLAIVDDVLTTGSTARELARELYDTGAESVELWVLARTSSKR
jgi:ComF family protein